jgi:allantoate deiminase
LHTVRIGILYREQQRRTSGREGRMDLDALTDEVLTRADALGRISDEPGRLTRTFLSPAARAAQDSLSAWMVDAGLRVRVDAVGNLIGSADASTDANVFVVASHVDTVPDAGKYDGILGVLIGIAAAKALAGRRFAKRLDVVAFSEEEGVRFRLPYLGSFAVCGRLTPELLARTDASGMTVADAIRAFGLEPADIPAAAYRPGQVVGYLEAHIEQGPVLEAKNLSLGVVPAIMGQTRAWVRFTGHAGHAGTQPMDLRRDALAAAAEFVTVVERTGRTTPGLRATVGSLTVSPGATNVVPGEVRLSVDVRHAEDAVRTRAVADLFAVADRIGKERGIAVAVEPAMDQPAVPCDPGLTGRLAATMAELGYPPEPVVSGAGHDAVVMAGLCPVAMLFVRSPGGISHHPDENVRREDVRAALEVMVRFLERELGLP